MRNKFIILSFALLALFGILLYQKAQFDDGKLHIVFCNVGQGDAIFIRTPQGVDILVDGGPDESVLKCLSSHMPFYDRDIELMFLTHPHADHLTGLIEVLKRYTVMSFNTEKVGNSTLVFRELEKTLSQKNLKSRFIYSGDSFKLSDRVMIDTLWPTKDYLEAKEKDLDKSDTNIDKNSFSLVQLLRYKNFTLLLTGDIQAEIVNKLVKDLAAVTILKIPHHGSNTGFNNETFELIHPSLAVISVGKHNRYHHPSEHLLSVLKEKGILYKRTDVDGEVEVVVSANTYVVR